MAQRKSAGSVRAAAGRARSHVPWSEGFAWGRGPVSTRGRGARAPRLRRGAEGGKELSRGPPAPRPRPCSAPPAPALRSKGGFKSTHCSGGCSLPAASRSRTPSAAAVVANDCFFDLGQAFFSLFVVGSRGPVHCSLFVVPEPLLPSRASARGQAAMSPKTCKRFSLLVGFGRQSKEA